MAASVVVQKFASSGIFSIASIAARARQKFPR
jgi:hypothetical protein